MARLLFWGLIIACVLIAVRVAVQSHQRPRQGRAGKGVQSENKAAEAMVACAHCGVYLPSSEALVLHGQTWCCREHAEAHGKA